MAAAGDDDLATLIANEQRGFRTILFAGVVTLVVMALMSVLMGVYFFMVSQNLARTTDRLEQNAFDTRRNIASQNNRLAGQERAIRRAYTDIRRAAGAGTEIEATPERIAETRAVVELYLLRGHTPNLTEQRAIRQFGMRDIPQISPALKALMSGAWRLFSFESSGESIAANAEELPADLIEALASFEAARANPELAPLAQIGIASVRYTDASSGRHNYSAEACQLVFDAAEGVRNGVVAPRPLYWRAQCERKLGHTSEALATYARSLEASAPAAREGAPRGPRGELEAENQLALDAFHGVGTTLIASANVPDNAPGMAEALAIAQRWCPERASEHGRSPRMALALSCLNEAIRLRRVQGQTENQQSGTAENITFAYLRDGDFDNAYQNTVTVERTGLFAWNEAMRAFTATRAEAGSRAERRAAGAAARGNVSRFSLGQFNLCELQALMEAEHFEALRQIISETHDDAEVSCPR